MAWAAGEERIRRYPTQLTIAPGPTTSSPYLTKVARLGGYPARAKDPPLGSIVMRPGRFRWIDFALGATLQTIDVSD